MPNCFCPSNKVMTSKKYYDNNKENMNIKRTELYHATKTEEVLIKMREQSKARYEAKKEEIKAKNLARYYDNIPLKQLISGDQAIC